MAKATKITKKPSLGVSGLGAPTRGSNNRVMTASWKVPSGLTSTKSNSRATGLDVIWSIGTSTGTYKATSSVGVGTTSRTLNLDSMRLGASFNRNSFYPRTNRRLNNVTITVRTKNNKGIGKSVAQTRRFLAPRVPTLTPLSFNTENGIISTTIDTDAGNDYYERLDTKYAITVTSPFLNGGKPTNTSDSASTSTSFSINYDARDYMRLDYNQYIKVVASAYARGYAGNSGTASRTEYISYPAQATITGVDVSGRDATGKCTIHINPNSTTEHPVDKVRLEIAADVTYDDPDDIPASSWESTEIIDNRNCTALSIATSELIPSRGNYSYVRVVTYHLHEGVLYRYSQPWRVTELEVPTAPPASINIEILEAHTGADGKSAVVLLGWNKDGQDDYTGTELSWSDDENTWKSTDEPRTHQFTWSDGEVEYGGVTYHDSAEITIKGLNEGEKYYIKARRYLEADNEQYSAYSNTATALTSEIPESIVASCERYIADGNPLSVYWTFAGNGIQTEWQIVRVAQYVKTKDEAVFALAVEEPVNDDLFKYYELSGTTYTLTSDTSVVEGKDYYIINKTYYTKSVEVYTAVTSPSDSSVSDYYEFYDNTVVAEGKGSAGATQISAERLAEMAIDNNLTFIVQASTGSGFVSSEEHTVTIIEQPTLQITGSSLVHVHEEDEQTYTGDIVQIDNSRDVLNVKSLDVTLEPIQSLNGYDKPWVGGAGKNKVNCADISAPSTSNTTYDVALGSASYVVSFDIVNAVRENLSNTSFLNIVSSGANNYYTGETILKVSDNSTLNSAGANINGRYYCTVSNKAIDSLVFLWRSNSYATLSSGAVKNIMVEVGTTPSAYEPYSNICPISGRTEVETVVSPTTSAEDGTTYTTALGRTVYGGEVEVVGGSLTDKMGMVDLGDLTWRYESNNQRFVTTGLNGLAKMSMDNNFISSAYVKNTTTQDGTGFFTSTGLMLYNRAYTDATAFKTAMSGVQLCYELAEPQTYQLSGQDIALLTGNNNVWSEGSIDLTTAEVLVDGDFLRTNNLSIDFKSNQLCDLITIVTSQGATGQFPQGVLMQASGDTIHSDVYRPSWTASNNDLTATINLPTGLNFWDGGRYTVSVVAVDRTTGLRSPEALLTVPVMWANQAVPPEQASYSLTTDTTVVEDEAYYEKVGDDYILVTPVGTENPSSEGWYTQNTTNYVTLTVIDEKDSDGDHTQAVRIALTPPTGSSESDVYDIYRMDIESPSLIGEGFPLTYTTVDEYAPFGKDVELKYRIAIRTIDGDVAFSDIDYEADCENIRFDWSGGSLELPYGNSVGDSFSKDTEIRKHMNGVSNGYWNQGVERKSSLSSSIIKIVQPRDIERARMLARYAGAVFVRLPNGSAFEADVQVTDLSIKNEAVTAVAFDATEIGLTQEFSLPTPFRLEE